MATETDEEALEDGEEEVEGLVPYAPDFTPTTLGKRLGEDGVLPWILAQAADQPPKTTLQTAIANKCLGHVANVKDRRDMASHVVQGLQNYTLVDVDDDGSVRLTAAGEEISKAGPLEIDKIFARHILTMCNGMRLVEGIQRFEVRSEKATLEALTEELDRSATAKNISTMKAWLQRAGVMKAGPRYVVDEVRLEEILGAGAKKLLGLEPPQVEFLLAARILTAQQASPVLEAPDVKLLAETRRPDVRIPSKALGTFVRRLIDEGLFAEAPKARSKGGTRVAVRLTAAGFKLSDDQVRSFVAQSGGGMLLSDLERLDEVVDGLGLTTSSAEALGRLGEMLAVHACLMLGLRVVGWRTRLPVEVDLTAERVVGLSYQRWHVQVKNTATELDADRIDREIGAAAGTGATHILFVVPRARATSAARAEIHSKTRLTHLHIYVLSADAFATPIKAATMLRELRGQEAFLSRLKRSEAERRERLP